MLVSVCLCKSSNCVFSDSGDSLFITQKPVPGAVRAERRHHRKLRADFTSHSDLEESESDSSSSESHGESRIDSKRKRVKRRPPSYSFPFLSLRKNRGTMLTSQQNNSLHVRINKMCIPVFFFFIFCYHTTLSLKCFLFTEFCDGGLL